MEQLKKTKKDVVIVGGGIAGLTAGYNLLKKCDDIKIVLLEREHRLGGLAKSHKYGDFVFDIGPKRFHTDDIEVTNFFHEIGKHVGLTTIDRSSKVLFLNRFFSWPLGKKDLFKLPLGVAISSVVDLFSKRKPATEDILKFENYIIGKYGKSLYSIFFKPYTEKFLRMNADEIHADWASTGINRSIINKENKGNSFMELIHQVLLPPKIEANFLYPESGGFGKFWDVCADIISRNPNIMIETGILIDKVQRKDGRLVLNLSDGRDFSCDHLLWSGRLPDLLQCIDDTYCSNFELPYLDTIFLDLVFKGNRIVNKDAVCQWLYVSSPNITISRISFPKNFHPGNIPDGYEGLCVEVTCKETEESVDEEQLTKIVIEELTGMNLIDEGAELAFKHLHRERSTYPIYHSNYKEEAEKSFKKIHDFSDLITPFGRSGAFWYNNADHSIRQALVLTDKLAMGEPLEFSFRKYFGGISEHDSLVEEAVIADEVSTT